MVATLVVSLSTALGYSALGLLLSALFRRTVVASVLAYGVVLVTTVVLPLVAISIGASGLISSFYFPGAGSRSGVFDVPPFGWPPASAWLTFVSPVMALISVLGSLFGTAATGYPSSGLLSVYIVRNSGVGPTMEAVSSFAPWVFNALTHLVFAAFALLVTARTLRPAGVRRWRWARKRAHGS